jgi:hypothetical protein
MIRLTISLHLLGLEGQGIHAEPEPLPETRTTILRVPVPEGFATAVTTDFPVAFQEPSKGAMYFLCHI